MYIRRLVFGCLTYCLVLGISSTLAAQQPSDSSSPRKKTADLRKLDLHGWLQPLPVVDTGVGFPHRYGTQDGPMDPFWAHLGNAGSPGASRQYTPEYGLGFNLFRNPYTYLFRSWDEPVWASPFVTTKATYAQGLHEEQFLRVEHGHNIAQRLIFGVDYTIAASLGAYANMRTKYSQPHVWLVHKANNQRHITKVFFRRRAAEAGIHGGVTSSEVFTFNRKATVPVLLPQAGHRWAESELRAEHWFRTGTFDTAVVRDSVKAPYLAPGLQLGLQTSLSREVMGYVDPQPWNSALPEIILRSDSTVDFTRLNQLTLGPALQHFDRQGSEVAYLALDQNWRHLVQQGRVFDVSALAIQGRVRAPDSWTGPCWHARLEAGTVIAGYNQGAYEVHAQVKRMLPLSFALQAFGGIRQTLPAFTDMEFLGNHAYWQRPRQQQRTAHLGLLGSAGEWKVGAEVHRFWQWSFLSTAGPFRSPQPFGLFRGSVEHMLEGRGIGYRTKVILQQVSAGADMHLPFVLAKASCWLNISMFDSSLVGRLGIDAGINSPYRSPQFIPWVGQFGLGQTLSPPYPELDLYFDFKVKRARLFFMVRNARQGFFMETGYFTVEDYPMPDASFIFGIDWMFY